MTDLTANFYNKFSICYPLVDILLKPQKKVLFKEVCLLPKGNLLEIGVGNGQHLKYYGEHQVTGIDTSVAMLNAAKKHNTGHVQLFEMDGKQLLFNDEVFDYAVLSHVIAVVDDPNKVLSEVYRVLKPGGKLFILNHFTPNNWLRYVDKMFEPFSKAFCFRSVFKISELTVLKQFTLVKEVGLGLGSYFKLLVVEKP